jgi:hypothetical protein
MEAFMENQTSYKLWNYEFVHYVPSTPRGGGEIKWHKVSEYREIHLPADVTDPTEYLQHSGCDNCTDLLEYYSFSVEE